ncbi:hypothetical protein HID58_003139, partial [Brassica napus]
VFSWVQNIRYFGSRWMIRYVYERRATEKLADDEEAETLFVALAEFEERCKEPERARNSMVIRKGLRTPLLGIGGFSMKMK